MMGVGKDLKMAEFGHFRLKQFLISKIKDTRALLNPRASESRAEILQFNPTAWNPAPDECAYGVRSGQSGREIMQ